MTDSTQTHGPQAEEKRDLPQIARHECRLLFAKLERLSSGPVRDLAEDLIVLAFSAGAAWAIGADWTAFATAPDAPGKPQ